MQKSFFSKIKKLKLGRWTTIGSFVLLAVALVIGTLGRAQGQGQIEVLYETEDSAPTNKFSEDVDNVEDQVRSEAYKCYEANSQCMIQGFQDDREWDILVRTVGVATGSAEESGSGGGGILQQVSKWIAMTYSPPASGSYYVAYVLENMGITNRAYAQGYGYFGLSPYLQVWRLMRNFVYVIFTILIMVVAISILLRQNFSSQAGLTVQQALPRIVLALLLVTFSYAIAGFLIDLMYWIMYAVGSFITADNSASGGNQGAGIILNKNFASIATTLILAGWDSAFSAVNSMVQDALGKLLGMEKLAGLLAGLTASVIVVIIMVVNMFKLFFVLLKAYAFIVLYVIFSPFILMMQVFNSQTFKKWALSIAANLSPFIVVFFIVMIVGIVTKIFKESGTGGWVPPFILSGGGTGADTMGQVVTLGLLLALPQLVDGIKKKIGGDEGFMGQIGGAALGNFMQGAKGAPGRFAFSTVGGATRMLASPLTAAAGGYASGVSGHVSQAMNKAKGGRVAKVLAGAASLIPGRGAYTTGNMRQALGYGAINKQGKYVSYGTGAIPLLPHWNRYSNSASFAHLIKGGAQVVRGGRSAVSNFRQMYTNWSTGQKQLLSWKDNYNSAMQVARASNQSKANQIKANEWLNRNQNSSNWNPNDQFIV